MASDDENEESYAGKLNETIWNLHFNLHQNYINYVTLVRLEPAEN